MKQWTWRTTLSPEDIFRRPWEWTLITASEAQIQSHGVPVVVVSRTPTGDLAGWYDEHATFFRGSGPPTAGTLRYYRYVGGVPPLAAVHAATETEPEAQTEETPETQKLPPEQVTAWIEVQLVDTLQRPVTNQKVHIELPDGSIAEARTDGEGLVRLDSIDPGSCAITFPEIDTRELKRIG